MTGAETVDWDTLKVGDREPPYCGEELCWDIQPGEPFYCSRRTGHAGRQHVAVASYRGVVAVWPVDGAA